jgi:hypothetical protein
MGCDCDVGVCVAVYLQYVCWGGGGVDGQFLPKLHYGHPLVSCISIHIVPVLAPPRHEMAISDADQKRLGRCIFVETATLTRRG